jgi:hypothetical protein
MMRSIPERIAVQVYKFVNDSTFSELNSILRFPFPLASLDRFTTLFVYFCTHLGLGFQFWNCLIIC